MGMAGYARLTVQLPPELHERLSVSARAARRSLSGEAVARLEATFDDDHGSRVIGGPVVLRGVKHTAVVAPEPSYAPFEEAP